MEFRQLIAFTTAAKTLNFTRAAEQLDYAQSSITAQVQSLEDELGIKLFERLGRKIALTKEGEHLLVYAKQILKLASEAKEMVSGSTLLKGTLSIGAPESLCISRLPALLREYRKRYPDVDIILKIGTCADFRRWLISNTIDLAYFLDREFVAPELLFETLLTEPMVVLARPDHRLAGKGSVLPEDMHGEFLILTENGCSYRVVFENMLAEAGAHPGSVLEFGSVEAIKKCAISGLGITLLPRMAVEEEMAKGQLVDLHWNGPDFNMTTQVAYHKDKWLSPALDAMLNLTREMIRPDSP